jgi:hypothetical protein
MVRPNKLIRKDFRPAQRDGELEMHVGVFDLDNLQEELALIIDVLAGRSLMPSSTI